MSSITDFLDEYTLTKNDENRVGDSNVKSTTVSDVTNFNASSLFKELQVKKQAGENIINTSQNEVVTQAINAPDEETFLRLYAQAPEEIRNVIVEDEVRKTKPYLNKAAEERMKEDIKEGKSPKETAEWLKSLPKYGEALTKKDVINALDYIEPGKMDKEELNNILRLSGTMFGKTQLAMVKDIADNPDLSPESKKIKIENVLLDAVEQSYGEGIETVGGPIDVAFGASFGTSAAKKVMTSTGKKVLAGLVGTAVYNSQTELSKYLEDVLEDKEASGWEKAGVFVSSIFATSAAESALAQSVIKTFGKKAVAITADAATVKLASQTYNISGIGGLKVFSGEIGDRLAKGIIEDPGSLGKFNVPESFKFPVMRYSKEPKGILDKFDEIGVHIADDPGIAITKSNNKLFYEATNHSANVITQGELNTLIKKANKTPEDIAKIGSYFTAKVDGHIDFVAGQSEDLVKTDLEKRNFASFFFGMFKKGSAEERLLQKNARYLLDQADTTSKQLSKWHKTISKNKNYKDAVTHLVSISDKWEELRKIKPSADANDFRELFNQATRGLDESTVNVMKELQAMGEVVHYSRNSTMNFVLNSNGYKQIGGNIVKPIKYNKDDTVLVKDFMTNEEILVKQSALQNVSNSVPKNPGWTFRTQITGWDVYIKTGKGEIKKIKNFKDKFSASSLSSKINSRGGQALYVPSGTTPKTMTNAFAKNNVSGDLETILNLSDLGYTPDEIARIAPKAWQKARTTTSKNISYDEFDVAANKIFLETGNLPLHAYREKLHQYLTTKYADFVDPTDWRKPLNKPKHIGGTEDTLRYETAKQIQHQLKLIYNVNSTAEQGFKQNLTSLVDRLYAKGSKMAKPIAHIDSILDKVDATKSLRTTNAFMKLWISAGHFLIQPSHAVTVMSSDSKGGKYLLDSMALALDKSQAKLTGKMVMFGKKWEDFVEAGVISNLKANEATEVVQKVGKFTKVLDVGFSPLYLGEGMSRIILANKAYDEALAAGFKAGSKELQRYVGVRTTELALDMSHMSRGVYNQGLLGATVFSFMQYPVKFAELFTKLKPEESLRLSYRLVQAYGITGLPIVGDIAKLLGSSPEFKSLTLNHEYMSVYNTVMGKDVNELLDSLGYSKREKNTILKQLENEKNGLMEAKLRDDLLKKLLNHQAENGIAMGLSDILHQEGLLSMFSSRMAWDSTVLRFIENGYRGLLGPALSSLTNKRTLNAYGHIIQGINGSMNTEELLELTGTELKKVLKETFTTSYNVTEGITKMYKLMGYTDDELKDISKHPELMYEEGLRDMDINYNILSKETPTKIDAFLQMLNIGNLEKKYEKKKVYELRRYLGSFKKMLERNADTIAGYFISGDDSLVRQGYRMEAFQRYLIEVDDSVPIQFKSMMQDSFNSLLIRRFNRKSYFSENQSKYNVR